jgi:phage terminase large subunit-like protein
LRTAQQRLEFLKGLRPAELEELSRTWWLWARKTQIPPSGNWRTWLMLGGRGAGKTRAGAEWLRSIVGEDGYTLGDSGGRVALIGETYQDVRSVMIEGESGLLAVHCKDQRPVWTASRRLLEWPNGTIGQVFSANDPGGLRGSQFGAAWCDALLLRQACCPDSVSP